MVKYGGDYYALNPKEGTLALSGGSGDTQNLGSLKPKRNFQEQPMLVGKSQVPFPWKYINGEASNSLEL